MTFTS